jgi:hypothetical protein
MRFRRCAVHISIFDKYIQLRMSAAIIQENMKVINRRNLLKMGGGLAICVGNPFAMAAQYSPTDAISIHWDFEGGSLEKIDKVGTDHYRCHVKGQVDQDGRNRQASWFYFRVDGAKGKLLTFTMVDLRGEYNYHPTMGAINKDTLPFYSSDGISWLPVETGSYDPTEPSLTYRVQISSDRIWIAYVPPYTLENFRGLAAHLARIPDVKIEEIGRSVQGREIPLITITDRSVPDRGKKVMWLMFRQHAWEAGSSWTGEGAMRFVTSSDPLAQQVRRKAIVKVLPLCDPDGVANGTVRFNVYGYDLNRNWDVFDPVKMPEIAAERRSILNWVDRGNRMDFFVTLHNDEGNEHLVGSPDERWFSLEKRAWSNWSSCSAVAATLGPQLMAATTTEGKPGRMNVVQGLSHYHGLPAFEIEMMIAKNPKLGRRPNVQDRLLAGRELVQALWKSI